MEMDLKKGNVSVRWVELGEGWQGDWDEDDPDDEELLRFDILQLIDGEWQTLESYCTQFPVQSSIELQEKALEYIMSQVYDEIMVGNSIKKIAQELSWLGSKSEELVEFISGETMKTTIIAHINENYTDYFNVFEVEHSYKTPTDLVDAIKATILTWQDTTEAGQKAFANSSYDFNWVDLATAIWNDTFPTVPGVSWIKILTDEQNYIIVDGDEHLMSEGE